MIFPAVYGGDFTEERTILLGGVPPEAEEGLLLRTLWVLAETLPGDPNNYWILTLGRFGTGQFQTSFIRAFPEGFPETPVKVDFDSEIRVVRGELLALRVSPTGASAPLCGLGVVAEYGLTRARAR